ncbi:hypothetical protein [Silvimonas iriomotensis]|uniref:Transmembrane protein n=1 Tax=Silvimonas iriomotensis TaxID=449662 RepID=A0ABQ2P6I3_9NEIS|nr:hypothetical protein [Silvimonas iriomotensis]GGP18889.1 hypothetical protein GCM10010970_07890 [Silvimonas iriomotensis]
MRPTPPLATEPNVPGLAPRLSHTLTSGLSWGAVLAGAATAAALAFILLILGFGLGLSAVSPWADSGATASAIGVSTIVWLALTQIIASGLGGYLAGRLRNSWVDIHVDEVYFRDTAHGLLVWAVATLITAAVLTSAIGTVLSGGAQAGASALRGAAAGIATGGAQVAAATDSNPDNAASRYFVDTLFRTNQAPTDAQTTGPGNRIEAGRIFANALRVGHLDAQDKQYLGSVVARQTGLDQPAAEARVAQTYDRLTRALNDADIAARNAADKARKAAAYSALWMFVALLCGAFFASWFATMGGKHRDRPAIVSN